MRPTYIILAILAAVAILATLVQPANGIKTDQVLQKMESSKPEGELQAKLRTDSDMVYLQVFNEEGDLVGPIALPVVRKTPEQWNDEMTKLQYQVTREAGTENAFSGELLKNSKSGVYTCSGCQLPLFRSETKFDSGTGWPSFYEPISAYNVVDRIDTSHGMVRTENVCARCEAHLGHVFEDGPEPTGRRFCMNSVSLNFVPDEEINTLAMKEMEPVNKKELVLAGGCFWCVEAVFEELDGVVDVISGYAGGTADTADYQKVSSGLTKHAEVVKVVYDADRVDMGTLLRIHFATHDPTTPNRQGNDVGPQYRSSVFYADEEEKAFAETFIADLEASKVFSKPIVTLLEPLDAFYEAEEYHQNYVCRNPMNPYVRAVALPKVEKLRKALAEDKK